jgi:hypothetical protein
MIEVIMFVLRPIYKSILCSALLASTLHAASSFPRGCEVRGFDYNQNNLILNETGDQSYYLIQNHSNTPIELERITTEESFMSPPLHATLDAMNWGAFASDIKNLNFKCYNRVENNIVPVSCRDVLEICQYPRVKFALSNMGNYWISFNKPQDSVIQDSVAKGIYLKW